MFFDSVTEKGVLASLEKSPFSLKEEIILNRSPPREELVVRINKNNRE